jgi:hypothetical protein
MRIPIAVSTLCIALAFQAASSSEPNPVAPHGPDAGDSRDAGAQAQTGQGVCRTRDGLSSQDFTAVMHTIHDAWGEGNARKAADCFTEDAVYSSPPSRGHHGRENLYQQFGGAKGPAVPMKIEWHHLVFDPTQQLGMGEFSYQYHLQTNGVVVVKFSNGLISNWREYDVPSDAIWSKFVGSNDF